MTYIYQFGYYLIINAQDSSDMKIGYLLVALSPSQT